MNEAEENYRLAVSPPAPNMPPAACMSSSCDSADISRFNHFATKDSSAVPAAFCDVH